MASGLLWHQTELVLAFWLSSIEFPLFGKTLDCNKVLFLLNLIFDIHILHRDEGEICL